MMAAETLFDCLIADDFSTAQLQRYEERFRASWAYQELYDARNYRKAFDKGLYAGLLAAGLQVNIPGLSLATKVGKKIKRELPEADVCADGVFTFTKEQSLFNANIQHEENQPCHLHINQADIENICLKQCTSRYGNPCQYFCPAEVYEIVTEPKFALKLNPSNCLHCKTCDVADPYNIITWMPPEGGGGPGYKVG
jgi:electron-transferring-flavoprotein dehydrogenase